MDIFSAGTAIGGHVIGDSDNIGDKLSEQNIEDSKIPAGVHVRLKIEGPVRIEPIKEIAIADEHTPGGFREARLQEIKDSKKSRF